MRVLVTGGAGFIGSHIVDKLIQLNNEVLVVDNLSTGSIDNLNKKAIFKQGCITDGVFVDKVFESFRPQYVIHQAAQSNANKSIENPVADCKTNILGTLVLLDIIRKYAVKKLVYASSAAVYGDGDKISLDEELPSNPISFYGLSKLTPENYIKLYNDLYNVNYTIFRYANVFGGRQNPQGEGGVVSVLINKMINNITPSIFGDGTQTRDFIYVEDVVEANILALQNDVNGTFNLSTNKETTINELYFILSDILRKKYICDYKPRKKGDILRSCLNNKKLKNQLGWEPRYSLEEGLKRTIEYTLMDEKVEYLDLINELIT